MKTNSFQSAMEAIELLRKHYPSSGCHANNLLRLKAFIVKQKNESLENFFIPEEIIESLREAIYEAFKDNTVATAHDALICYRFLGKVEDLHHPRLFNYPN